MVSKTPQTPQLGAKMAQRPPILEPRWPQDSPSWIQDGPKTPHLGAKMAPRAPILEESKMAPRPLNLDLQHPTWSQDAPYPPSLAGGRGRRLATHTYIYIYTYRYMYIYIIERERGGSILQHSMSRLTAFSYAWVTDLEICILDMKRLP